VILRTRPKETNCGLLLAVINAFAFIRKQLRTEGGGGHRTMIRIIREDGQAVAEYAVILALVAAVLVFTYSSLGAATVRLLNTVVSQL